MRLPVFLLFLQLSLPAGSLLARGNPALEGNGGYIQGELHERKKDQLPSISAIITQEFPEGVGHILSGTDHICFVIGLALILASWWKLVKVVTFFTIAHAITLTVASLNLIPLGKAGTTVIEILVAVSIAWVGIENLLIVKNHKSAEKLVRHRSWLAFGFGLVHGLAFAEHFRASMLHADFGSGPVLFGFLMKILFFNLGVDAGQLLFAGGAFFLLWAIREKSSDSLREGLLYRFTFYPSVTIAILGLGWMIERIHSLVMIFRH